MDLKCFPGTKRDASQNQDLVLDTLVYIVGVCMK